MEYQVAGARRWRLQFRFRGSRRESAVAQLFSLGVIYTTMHYNVIFDITQTEFQQWFGLACGIFGIILTASFLLYQSRIRWKFTRKAMATFMLCYFSLFSLLAFFHSYQNYLHINSAMQQSQCEVTEGVVTQFHHPPNLSRGSQGICEAFVVSGVQFSYRTGSAQNGFHQAGIIHDGMQVRIYHYDKIDSVDKDIARLEVAP